VLLVNARCGGRQMVDKSSNLNNHKYKNAKISKMLRGPEYVRAEYNNSFTKLHNTP